MRKIISFILLMCMVLTFVACADNESTKPESTPSQSATPGATPSATPDATPDATPSVTPDITLQEVYEAGKNYAALLGDHENVHILVTSNGKIIKEEYFSNEYFYSFYDAEYMDIGQDNTSFLTDHSEYIYVDGIYALKVTLTPDGMIDLKDFFPLIFTSDFIASNVATGDNAVITEKDGFIAATRTFDADEIATMGDDIASCVETYTLDAKTRQMVSVKTVYTYKDGTVEEGIATIARDVEAPDGAKPFIAYEQETENLRTITIVSNPGTENEKTESLQVAKGVLVGCAPDTFTTDKLFTVYADAACTQLHPDQPDTQNDVTLYIKWDE